jgi:ATP-dependent DNA helicase RecG
VYFLPRSYQDRRTLSQFATAPLGVDLLFIGTIVKPYIAYFKGRKRAFDMVVHDESGSILLRYFRFNMAQVNQQYRKGRRISIFGKISEFQDKRVIIHPEVELIPIDEPLANQYVGRILPVYPKIPGVFPKSVRKIVAGALTLAPTPTSLPLPKELTSAGEISDLLQAMQFVHAPPREANIESLNNKTSAAHKTIAIDELFYYFYALLALREQSSEIKASPISWPESLFSELSSRLPYTLSPSQMTTLTEIKNDLFQHRPMIRLVMGDVGSGKTIVAFLAAAVTAASGVSAAILAPTKILALQHYESLCAILQDFPIQVRLVTAEKDSANGTQKLALENEAAIFIGTHALIDRARHMKHLVLVIFDEQQRFGLLQRSELTKGETFPHLLSLSATPIPRSLSLKYFGGVDISYLENPPAQTRQVSTCLLNQAQEKNLWTALKNHVNGGKKAILVCPGIQNASSDTTTKVMNQLKELDLNHQAVTIHRRIDDSQIEDALHRFKSGTAKILVATTIIEVGLHVPDVDLMVVFSANQFGLSQLHQLRGRIGRDGRKATMALVASPNADEEAIERLRRLTVLTDGFAVSEYDLRLRGRGEFWGKNQSGPTELDPARLGNFINLETEVFTMVQKMLQAEQQNPKRGSSPWLAVALERWKDKLDLGLLA